MIMSKLLVFPKYTNQNFTENKKQPNRQNYPVKKEKEKNGCKCQVFKMTMNTCVIEE